MKFGEVSDVKRIKELTVFFNDGTEQRFGRVFSIRFFEKGQMGLRMFSPEGSLVDVRVGNWIKFTVE